MSARDHHSIKSPIEHRVQPIDPTTEIFSQEVILKSDDPEQIYTHNYKVITRILNATTNLNSPLTIKHKQQKIRVTGLHPNMAVSQLHELMTIFSTLNDPMDAHSIRFLSEAQHFLTSSAQEETTRYTGPAAVSSDKHYTSKSNRRSFVHNLSQTNSHPLLIGSNNEKHPSTEEKIEYIAVVQPRDRTSTPAPAVPPLRRPSSDDEDEDATHQEPAHLASPPRNPGLHLDVVSPACVHGRRDAEGTVDVHAVASKRWLA
jgi:hypothetical protein